MINPKQYGPFTYNETYEYILDTSNKPTRKNSKINVQFHSFTKCCIPLIRAGENTNAFYDS